MNEAETRFGSYLQSVEWSEDKTSAKILGSGFDVKLWVDDQSVHAEGQIPFLLRLAVERPVKKFLEDTFKKKG
jgi:hypothetical protein